MFNFAFLLLGTVPFADCRQTQNQSRTINFTIIEKSIHSPNFGHEHGNESVKVQWIFPYHEEYGLVLTITDMELIFKRKQNKVSCIGSVVINKDKEECNKTITENNALCYAFVKKLENCSKVMSSQNCSKISRAFLNDKILVKFTSKVKAIKPIKPVKGFWMKYKYVYCHEDGGYSTTKSIDSNTEIPQTSTLVDATTKANAMLYVYVVPAAVVLIVSSSLIGLYMYRRNQGSKRDNSWVQASSPGNTRQGGFEAKYVNNPHHEMQDHAYEGTNCCPDEEFDSDSSVPTTFNTSRRPEMQIEVNLYSSCNYPAPISYVNSSAPANQDPNTLYEIL